MGFIGAHLFLLYKGVGLILEFEVILSCSSRVVFVLYLDWMSSLFFSVVSLIAGRVVYYSIRYMRNDMNSLRFLYLVLLFVGSIFFLVFRLNLISILLG